MTISARLIYITDWFSTFLRLAGLSERQLPRTDSETVRSLLRPGGRSRRREIILNLDSEPDLGLWSAAIRRGDYKLLWGQHALLRNRIPEEAESVQLYNVRQDPRERRNLVNDKPNLVERLKSRLLKFLPGVVNIPEARKGVKKGWPGRQKGHKRGYISTGWCEAVV